MISLEDVDLILTRVTKDKFTVSLGDIPVSPTELDLYVGGTMTFPIKSILIQRNNGKAIGICNITEGLNI